MTIHYVDTGLDTGPAILQKHVPIYPDDTLETLEQRIHAVNMNCILKHQSRYLKENKREKSIDQSFR